MKSNIITVSAVHFIMFFMQYALANKWTQMKPLVCTSKLYDLVETPGGGWGNEDIIGLIKENFLDSFQNFAILVSFARKYVSDRTYVHTEVRFKHLVCPQLDTRTQCMDEKKVSSTLKFVIQSFSASCYDISKDEVMNLL